MSLPALPKTALDYSPSTFWADPSSRFIVESVNEGLKSNRDESNDIYLEGIAAKFGIRNNNNRVYEKHEYLPHLEYLNEKIQNGALFGEMDHPQNFDVSLKNVSHVIEALYYDPKTDDVRIKLRLLDTPMGRIARALVEAGCTISVSSRAAGQVLNEGRVKLHKIFTYDLVAEPGFKQASLNRTINESLDHSYNAISESLDLLRVTAITTTKFQDVSESFNLDAGVKIYKTKETALVENNSNRMSEFITKTEFNKYSQTIKKKYDALTESMASMKVDENEKVDVKKLVAFTNYLAEELKNAIKFSNYLAETIDKSIHYTEHVSEKVNNVIDYSDYIGEKVGQSIQFGEYLAEKLNETVNYADYISGKLNETVNYTNYLAETLDKGIQFTDYVGEQVNNVIDYSNYLGESVTKGIAYSQYVAENLDKNIAFSEYIVEGLNEMSVSGVTTKTATSKLNESIQTINESLNINVNETSSIDSIVEAVQAIANKVESNTADAVLESQYPFLKIMSKEGKNNFKALDAQTKTDIVSALGSLVWTNESEVNNIIQAIITKKNENVPAYIRFMPVEYKNIYEALTERERSTLAAQAYGFTLVTPYQVKNFWQTRNFAGIAERIEQQNNTQHLNESQGKEGYISLQQAADTMRGYSLDYVNRFKKK